MNDLKNMKESTYLDIADKHKGLRKQAKSIQGDYRPKSEVNYGVQRTSTPDHMCANDNQDMIRVNAEATNGFKQSKIDIAKDRPYNKK